MLGTGTPVADPERSGPAVAVVVNDRAYLVDCGPGVVRRAAAADKRTAIKAKELARSYSLRICIPTTRSVIPT